jgi:hypothetical protein
VGAANFLIVTLFKEVEGDLERNKKRKRKRKKEKKKKQCYYKD